jgi:hypothetical protein
MRKCTVFYNCLLIILPIICGSLNAHEILVNTQDGETFAFDVDPAESFGALQDKIIALSDGKQSNLLIEIPQEGKPANFQLPEAHSQGGYLGYPRNYHIAVTDIEKKDIRYIVTTLANKNLIDIYIAKPDLEAAGERIDHIHPLRFLMTIFTDEELKVGVRNIRGKGWVWHHFLGGLKDCLGTETQIGNMKDEYIFNFAQIVKIDTKIIVPTITQQKWDDFVDLLITHIPRKGDHDRYDT